MSFYNLIFLLNLIFQSYSTNAFYKEAIIGGYEVPENTYNYYASIQYREITETKYSHICGGAILSETFVISDSYCFTYSRTMAPRVYAVGIGALNLTNDENLRIEVRSVYIPNGNYKINKIAMIKLKIQMDFKGNPTIFPLSVPQYKKSFVGNLGVVSGYGYTWAELIFNTQINKYVVINGGSSLLLKYASVEVVSDAECQLKHGFLESVNIYGVMMSEPRRSPWGNCKFDRGNPLVYNHTLIGILTEINQDCDDTRKGGIYIKVSCFSEYINEILLHKTGLYLYYNDP